MSRDPLKVLVVGQTPPPYHGQSVMIERLVAGRFRSVELHHVRMAFSPTIEDVGRARPGKLLHLAGVIRRIVAAQIKHRATMLYYPPSGPNRIPMYRDIALLLAVRPLFRHTVFHFHAGGLTDLIPRLTSVERILFSRAYAKPDCAILLSELNPPDGERLNATRTEIIPYGIEDNAPHFERTLTQGSAPPTILFVGMLTPSKGVNILLEACQILKNREAEFRVQIMGCFSSNEYERDTREFVAANKLDDTVSFLGVRTGDEKWQTFADADIFCFPSFYESETFGLVVLEAMQFGLPVVATQWRGIPSLVSHDESGYLAPPRDAEAIANNLEILLRDPEKTREMGHSGRQRYLDDFTLERWYSRMEAVFLEVAGR